MIYNAVGACIIEAARAMRQDKTAVMAQKIKSRPVKTITCKQCNSNLMIYTDTLILHKCPECHTIVTPCAICKNRKSAPHDCRLSDHKIEEACRIYKNH